MLTIKEAVMMELFQSYLAAGGLTALAFGLILAKNALKRYALRGL